MYGYTEKQMKKSLTRAFQSAMMVFAVIIGMLGTPVLAQAAEEADVLRVAFYPMDGFFEYDEDGNEAGYGVDLLNKISQYTGIDFKYIETDSAEGTMQLLIDGDADICMPLPVPAEPSTAVSYTSSSVLDSYEVLLTMKDRDELYYQDYDRIRTLKIAVMEYTYKADEIQEYLRDIGVAEEQILFCDEYTDCEAAVRSGRADAMITNIMDMTSDMKLLEHFNNISYYIAMPADSSYIRRIDRALAQVRLEEPSFITDLYEKWFPKRTDIPLTMEESVYLSKQDSIKFGFRRDEGYLSHFRDGEFYGIYVEQAKMICEKLGVKFEAVALEDCLTGEATADVYAGFFYDQNYAEKWGFGISNPIREINYYLIQKKERNFDASTCKIAAIEHFRYTSDYLAVQYPNAEFVYCNSYRECLDAVEKNRADMAIINNYIAEYYLEMYQYSDLSVRLSTDYSHLFCFATSNNNERMASILSKGISMLTDEEIEQTYLEGQSDKPDTHTIIAFMYKNPIAFAVIITVVAVLLLSSILLSLSSRKRNLQNKKLEEALSIKSNFMARMSHDMRTPLNVIMGMSRLALENQNPEDTNSCLNKIDIASEFLLGLINDILDVERLNAGEIKLHLEPYSKKEFSQYIEAVISPLCEQKNISFENSYEGASDFTVMQDRMRINQVFFNLLTNAVKFTPEGGKIRLHTSVDTSVKGKLTLVSTVSDNGIGMSPEFQQHMYEAFAQEKQTIERESQGAGLGLSIVKQMCTLMNTDISVESEPGKGTTFTIKGIYNLAPESVVRQQAKEQDAIAAVLVDADKILENKTILVCEDHPLNQEIIRRVLEKKKIQVLLADDGKCGVETFKNSTPGSIYAILMDIRMPVMDGVSAAKAIRGLSRPDAESVPIIALTANAYEEDINQYLEAGMNAHLAKPIEPDKVYQILAQMAENKEK